MDREEAYSGSLLERSEDGGSLDGNMAENGSETRRDYSDSLRRWTARRMRKYKARSEAHAYRAIRNRICGW